MRKFIVLPMAILMCVFLVTPAFAVSTDYSDPANAWTVVDVSSLTCSGFTLGSNRFSLSGASSRYKQLQDNSIEWISSTPISTGHDFFADPNLVYEYNSDAGIRGVTLFTQPWVNDVYNNQIYAKHPSYTLYTDDVVNTLSWRASAVWFYTDIWFDPGYYEFDCSFNIDSYLLDDTAGSSAFYRTSVTDISFSNGDHKAQIMKGPTDSTKFSVNLIERSQLVFSSSYPSGVYDYSGVHSQRQLRMKFILNISNLSYRVVDPADIQALSNATTDADNSLHQSNELETHWVGVMNDYFSDLNLANFSWDSGLSGAFSLVSDLFMRLWGVFGKYNILYVFPLTLSVVLLLVGRISRTGGRRSSGGDD